MEWGVRPPAPAGPDSHSVEPVRVEQVKVEQVQAQPVTLKLAGQQPVRLEAQSKVGRPLTQPAVRQPPRPVCSALPEERERSARGAHTQEWNAARPLAAAGRAPLLTADAARNGVLAFLVPQREQWPHPQLWAYRARRLPYGRPAVPFDPHLRRLEPWRALACDGAVHRPHVRTREPGQHGCRWSPNRAGPSAAIALLSAPSDPVTGSRRLRRRSSNASCH